MDNITNALTHLIRAGREALYLETVLNEVGYKDTPYFALHGQIADAVYALLGEHTDSFDESKTFAAMHDLTIPPEEYAQQLSSHSDALIAYGIRPFTRKAISEIAAERGIHESNLVGLILSEWVYKNMHLYSDK